jgi:hypothetical protein
LNRFEFIEFLVRLSAIKYPKVEMKSQAFETLLHSYILPAYDKKVRKNFKDFRSRFLLLDTTLDSLLYANRQGFERLYQIINGRSSVFTLDKIA